MSFPEEQAEVQAEGIPFSFVIGLFEDVQGNDPPEDRSLGAEYAEEVDITDELPVGADMSGRITDQIPWAGTLPGKCAVSRDMVMLKCWSSTSNAPGLAAIRDDWANR